MKKGIIIISHGSTADNPSEALYRVKNDIQKKYPEMCISTGFMEFESLSIPEAIDDMVLNKGVKTIRILPYFLQDGKHVKKDIPAIIDKAREKYSDVDIQLASYIGYDSRLADILQKRLADLDPDF